MESFRSLIEIHYSKDKINPYLVALIEDSSKNAALCDHYSLRQWFTTKQWNPIKCTNPKTTNLTCERIVVFSIDALGNIAELEKHVSVVSFKSSRYKAENEIKEEEEAEKARREGQAKDLAFEETPNLTSQELQLLRFSDEIMFALY
jgi:hypothetical protein